MMQSNDESTIDKMNLFRLNVRYITSVVGLCRKVVECMVGHSTS
jgi:hypothetical protein